MNCLLRKKITAPFQCLLLKEELALKGDCDSRDKKGLKVLSIEEIRRVMFVFSNC